VLDCFVRNDELRRLRGTFFGAPSRDPGYRSGRAEDESNLLTCDVDATVLSVWMPLDSKASRI